MGGRVGKVTEGKQKEKKEARDEEADGEGEE